MGCSLNFGITIPRHNQCYSDIGITLTFLWHEASQRLGLGGTRSGLFYQFADLIEEKKPEVVVIENVEGLFNSNGGRDFGVILFSE